MQPVLGLSVLSTLLTNCPELYIADTFMSYSYIQGRIYKKIKCFRELAY